jgi:hypothetical protein
MVAQCSCRACGIEVTGSPTLNAICHCRDCRRRTGSAFGWSTYWRDEDIVAVSGPLNKRTLEIAPPQSRWFCGACGGTVYWKSDGFPGNTGIPAGCFDDLPAAPDASYLDSKRCVWLAFDRAIEPKG